VKLPFHPERRAGGINEQTPAGRHQFPSLLEVVNAVLWLSYPEHEHVPRERKHWLYALPGLCVRRHRRDLSLESLKDADNGRAVVLSATEDHPFAWGKH
jgi:hypothetical protein